MSKNQKTVIAMGCAVACLLAAYPPMEQWQSKAPDAIYETRPAGKTGWWLYRRHAWIAEYSQYRQYRLDCARLTFELLAVGAATACVALLCGTKGDGR